MLKPHALEDLGVLVPDLNPVNMNSRGARSLIGLSDLLERGKLSLLPGYVAARSEPVLATVVVSTTTATFSNGSKTVEDTTGSLDFKTNADESKRVYPGDFVLGPDRKLYVVESVESDTVFTLKTPYEGPTVNTAQFVVPTTSVDTTADTITFSVDPEWVVGQVVLYENAGGASIDGLVDGSAYYVIDNISGVVQLSATEGGAAIDLGPGKGNSSQYFYARADYQIIHRIWMLKQFSAQAGGLQASASQNYALTWPASLGGTFTNTRANPYGVSLTPYPLSSLLPATTVNTTQMLRGSWTGNTAYGYSLGYMRFRVTADRTIDTMLIPLVLWGQNPSYYPHSILKFQVRIETDDGSGKPSGTLLHANAYKNINVKNWSDPAAGAFVRSITFKGSFTLQSSTDYHVVFVMQTASEWVKNSGYTPTLYSFCADSVAAVSVYNPQKKCGTYSVGYGWTDTDSRGLLSLNFYPISGTNTYKAEVLDTGITVGTKALANVTITRGYRESWATDIWNLVATWQYSSAYPGWTRAGYGDTYSWKLECADSISAGALVTPWTVINSATALTAEITKRYTGVGSAVNDDFTLSSAPPWVVGTKVIYVCPTGSPPPELTSGNPYYIQSITTNVIKVSSTSGGPAINLSAAGDTSQYFYACPARYWQLTHTLTSANGSSTPLITGASIQIVDPTNAGSSSDVVGVGKYVYKNVLGTPVSISNSIDERPSGNPAGACIYQRSVMWTTGGRAPRYWNGVEQYAANIDALAPWAGGVTGIDPPLRADCMSLYNDKLFLYRNVSGASGSSYTGDSTTLVDEILTDNTATPWVTSPANFHLGWRLYPNVEDASTGYPFKYWSVTASGATTITCSGANMTTYGTTGDAYMLIKNYRKTAWYCTETEPSDWPSASFLQFDDEDGDIIQNMMAWNGRLVSICRSQVWLVSGYGPTTGWTKTRISSHDGTLSPWSVVDGGEMLAWWGERGIMGYNGMYNAPIPISEAFNSIVLTDLNSQAREQVVGIKYRGLVLWSYPTSDSNVNNKTILYNPTTGRWACQAFGMYCPTIFVDQDTGEEILYFQDPISGTIMQWGIGYSFNAASQPFEYASSYVISSSPTEKAQFVVVRVTARVTGDIPVQVAFAKEYQDNYTLAGDLLPIDYEVTGRRILNAEDSVYICRLPETARASALSIKLLGEATEALEIFSVEVSSDAAESATFG